MAQLNPYLSFRDNARQAMQFYQTVFGGTLHISTFAEYHASEDPAEGDKVMHATLEGDNSILFMASDTPNRMDYTPGANISMSLSGTEEALLRRYWSGLSDGATVVMPLEPAPWGDTYGMLTDKFGVNWMVNITNPQGQA